MSKNPKDIAARGKPPLHLIPGSAEVLESLALSHGAYTKGYGPWNWRGIPVDVSNYVSAARRHLISWFDGEDLDHESGVSHLAHARASLGIAIDAIETGNAIDDRPPAGAAARLIREHTRERANAPESLTFLEAAVEAYRAAARGKLRGDHEDDALPCGSGVLLGADAACAVETHCGMGGME